MLALHACQQEKDLASPNLHLYTLPNSHHQLCTQSWHLDQVDIIKLLPFYLCNI